MAHDRSIGRSWHIRPTTVPAIRTPYALAAASVLLASIAIGIPCSSAQTADLTGERPVTPGTVRVQEIPGSAFLSGRVTAPTLVARATSRVGHPGTELTPEVGSGPEFMDAHLVPGLCRRLGELGSLHPAAVMALRTPGNNSHQEFNDLALRGTLRASQRAVEDFLLEATGLGARAEFMLNRARPNGGAGAGGVRTPRKISFGVGASRMLPRLDIGYSVGNDAKLRVSLRAAGSIGLQFTRSRGLRNWVFANYDNRERRYDAGWRVGF